MFLRVGRKKNKNCPSCGEERTYPALTEENKNKAAVLCGRDTVQLRNSKPFELEKLALHMKRAGYDMQSNPYLAMMQLEGHRIVLFRDGRVLIHGTKDVTEARSVYQRYFG